jgi:heme/copper-type cytochrome/quinol oxidase subunit 3
MSQARPMPAQGGVSTPEEAAYEARALEGAIWTGGRVAIGAFAFAFAALAFAYFYLRSLNSENLWRPHDVTAPTGPGAAIMALAVAAAGLYVVAMRRLRTGRVLDWAVAGWAAVASGLVAFGLQIWELTDLPFAPGMSGYSSVFIGWAGMNLLLLLTGLYWTETLLARQIRLQRGAEEEGGGRDMVLSNRPFRVDAEACYAYWWFIALVSVFFWVFFYVAR